mmetsp:Transcript_109400/g.153066  ORF Transcript_109400/g.153066 Transcript_109400/m.153066 type:complete len:237 (+) Transcript_109400:683-1393(+)
MAAIPSLVNGHLRVLASIWRVAKRPVASLWISASAPALWKVSSGTTWWEMLWLASFTRSQRRVESPQLAELVPFTPTMVQMSHSLHPSPRTFWRRTCPMSCLPWTWQQSQFHFGGPLTSSTLPHLEPSRKMRNGSWASSTAPAWASRGAWPPTARRTPPTPPSTTSRRRTRRRPRSTATSWARRLLASSPSEVRSEPSSWLVLGNAVPAIKAMLGDSAVCACLFAVQLAQLRETFM